jgi:hypothetical protein
MLLHSRDDLLIIVICDLRLEGLDAGAQLFEGAGDLAVLRVGGEIEGDGALALEQRELDVLGEEEELGWVRCRHGCVGIGGVMVEVRRWE